MPGTIFVGALSLSFVASVYPAWRAANYCQWVLAMSKDVVLQARGIRKSFRQNDEEISVLLGVDFSVAAGEQVTRRWSFWIR